MSDLLTTVTGTYGLPLDNAQAIIDNMTATQALDHVGKLLTMTRQLRDRYEQAMLDCDDSDVKGYKVNRHCWVIECNNIVRFKEMLIQIRGEIG